MLKITEGQCGLCAHYGETATNRQQFVQIRVAGEAPADLVADCGHPSMAPLHLQVAPTSGCAGYSPAKAG